MWRVVNTEDIIVSSGAADITTRSGSFSLVADHYTLMSEILNYCDG